MFFSLILLTFWIKKRIFIKSSKKSKKVIPKAIKVD